MDRDQLTAGCLFSKLLSSVSSPVNSLFGESSSLYKTSDICRTSNEFAFKGKLTGFFLLDS